MGGLKLDIKLWVSSIRLLKQRTLLQKLRQAGAVFTQSEPPAAGRGLDVWLQSSFSWHSNEDSGHGRLQREQSVGMHRN